MPADVARSRVSRQENLQLKMSRWISLQHEQQHTKTRRQQTGGLRTHCKGECANVLDLKLAENTVCERN